METYKQANWYPHILWNHIELIVSPNLQHEIEREIKERVLNIYSDMETDAMSHDDVCHKLKHLGEYCDSLD